MPLLFDVAQLGYRDLFLWLVQHGAAPNKRKPDGQSIEDDLAELDEPDMITFIKEHVTRRPVMIANALFEQNKGRPFITVALCF
jgi:hypothetical protein